MYSLDLGRYDFIFPERHIQTTWSIPYPCSYESQQQQQQQQPPDVSATSGSAADHTVNVASNRGPLHLGYVDEDEFFKLGRLALAVARRWILILNAHPDPKDARLRLSQASRRLGSVNRRADLMTEARSLVENARREGMGREAFRRHDGYMPPPPVGGEGSSPPRQGNDGRLDHQHHPRLRREGPSTEPVVQGDEGDEVHPTVTEVRDAIRRLSGADELDVEFLERRWTEERVQVVWDGDEDGDIAMDGMGFGL